MPRKEVPIAVTRHIIVDGTAHREDEFTKEEAKRMYSEMIARAMIGLGYIPVETT